MGWERIREDEMLTCSNPCVFRRFQGFNNILYKLLAANTSVGFKLRFIRQLPFVYADEVFQKAGSSGTQDKRDKSFVENAGSI